MVDVVGYRVEEPIVVRVPGLPASTLRALRFDDSFARAQDIVARQRWLVEEGAALSEALYRVVGERPPDAVRPRLLALRRALFQVRNPGAGAWNAMVAAALPTPVVPRVERWLAARAEWGRRSAALPAALAAETESRRAALRAAAADPRFRRALREASPGLAAELARWLADDQHRPRPRKLLRLAAYLSRATAKTSPFSSFTVTGLGAWRDQGPAVRYRDPGPPRAVMELNRFLFDEVVQVLATRSGRRSALPLRITPSATEHQDGLLFLGPRPEEPIVRVPESPALRLLLDVAGAAPGCTFDGLRRRLATITRDGDPDASDRFLDRLLQVGLLEPRLPIPDQSGDPLGDLLDWLVGDPGAELAAAAGAVGRLGKELGHAAEAAELDSCAVDHDLVRREVDTLRGALGIRPTARPGRREQLVHDNVVFHDQVVDCSLHEWRPVLDDLDVLRRWLAVQDLLLPLRLALGSFLGERFGVGATVPFLAFHQAVQQEITRATATGEDLKALFALTSEPSWRSRSPRLREAVGLREQARRTLGPASGADGVIRREPATLLREVSGWPAWVTPAESTCFYLQPLPGEPLVVAFNAATIGYGKGRSRWLRLLDQVGARSGVRGWRPARPGAAVAELGGAFGSALNLRAPWLPYELDYPWSTSTRPAAQRVRLGDLVVAHDPELDLAGLRWARDGTQVRPLHLGMMADFLLPPAAGLLRMGFGGPCDLRTGFLHPEADPADASTGEVVRLPRVEVGRVVLQRGRWVAPARVVPLQRPGEADAAHLVRLVTWLRSWGIPDRCFVRIRTAARQATAAGGADLDWVFDRSAKPMFVDFASWYLVQAWQRLVTGADDQIIFEEALPDPMGASGPGPGQAAVGEFLVEISVVADG